MALRLGEAMVRRGLLTDGQVQQILAEQARAHRPFGVLAEELFDLSPADIEAAWVDQYATLTENVDPRGERKDARAIALVDRRQAWQFRVLPLRFDGREVIVATTKEHLARALRFLSRCLTEPCYIVLTEAEMLGEALMEHYPLAGMTPRSIREPITTMASLQP